MAHSTAPLCSERHYTGAAASGRFATDRSVRPELGQAPDEETLRLWEARRPANMARYLRSQDAVGLVMDCQDARLELAGLYERLARVHEALACTDVSEEPELFGQLQEAARRLDERAGAVLSERRALSGQLRALGISPKEQAQIWIEVERRSERARAARGQAAEG